MIETLIASAFLGFMAVDFIIGLTRLGTRNEQPEQQPQEAEPVPDTVPDAVPEAAIAHEPTPAPTTALTIVQHPDIEAMTARELIQLANKIQLPRRNDIYKRRGANGLKAALRKHFA